MASFWGEMKRRNVFKVGTVYIIVAWLVIQVADTTFGAFGIPDWVMRATVLLLILGLPIVLIFAWAFEITPQGLKRTEDVDKDNSITHITGRKFDYAFIAILIVAVAYFAVDKFVLPGVDFTRAEREARVGYAIPDDDLLHIAVLPFTNMSADAENEYFSDGVSEELLNYLSDVDGLKVTSRTTAFSFKGSDLSIPEIARQLKVSHVLEGSVRKSGNRVRITAQLIEVASDAHLWSDTFDRTLDDIFQVQEDISRNITNELMAVLGRDPVIETNFVEAPTDSVQAYELYLQGKHFFRQRGKDNLQKAIELVDRAVAIDPNFARAWAIKGAAWTIYANYDPVVDESVTMPEARQALGKALDLDPDMALAHASLGLMATWTGDWQASFDSLQRAIALAPDEPMPHLWLSIAYMKAGFVDRAVQKQNDALSVDQGLGILYAWKGLALASMGDNDGAEEHFRRAIEMNFYPLSYAGLSRIEALRGNLEAAVENIQAFERVAGVEQSNLRANLIRSQADPELKARTLNELEASGLLRDRSILTSLQVWQLLDDLDETELALDVVALSIEPPQSNVATALLWSPQRKALRENPRFLETMNVIKLNDYWKEYGYPSGCTPRNGGLYCE